MAALPRSLSSIVVSVVGLAMFLILASLLLVSSPISSTVRGYFYGIDRKVDVAISALEQGSEENVHTNNLDYMHKNSSSGSNPEAPTSSNNDKNAILTDKSPSDGIQVPISSNGSESDLRKNNTVEKSPKSTGKEGTSASSATSSATKNGSVELGNSPLVTCCLLKFFCQQVIDYHVINFVQL